MRTRWLNFLVLLSLVLGLMPLTAAQAASETAPMAQPAIQETPDIEVESALLSQLAADETTGYMIYFKEEPDLSPAYEMDWIERGRFVANALNQAALRSQANVRAYLDFQGIEYKAFWIDNVISVEASNRATFDGLMAFGEINAIRQHRELGLVEPEEATAPSAPQAVEPNIIHVLADQVWSQGYTGEGLVVANVDTGVRYTHEALVDHYRGNLGGSTFDHDYNWWDPYGDHPTEPGDDNGHGSHTMGTMVGDDGGANQIGMAPGAQWMACRACNTNQCSDTALLECAEFFAAPWDLNQANANPDKRPNVVNNSWGDCGRSYDGWYQDVVDAWHAAGIYPVFSNGNASNCSYPTPPGLNTVGNPARYGNVTGVGSTGRDNGQYATHSNWGPTDNPDTVNPKPGWADLKPQVLAPGVNIRSSVNSGDSAYANYGGTSMSAPHVTGLIALMWSAAPCLIGDYATTETIIEDTAIPIPYDDGTGGGAHVPNYATGWGEINALAAVEAAAASCGDSAIVGQVTDSTTSAPVAGATVLATSATDQRKTASDADGLYTLSVFSDTYTLAASRYGYQTTVIPGVAATTGATTTQDIALTPAAFYEVSGQVTDATTGWPLYAHISITGDPVDPIAPDNAVWTDPATGQYSIMLAEGITYTFAVEAWVAGYDVATGDVGPLTSDVSNMDFALQADMGSCAAPGYYFVDGLMANFEDAAFPPAGWTVVNNGGTCDWAGDDPGGRGNLTGGTGKFAVADSDACGSGTTMNTDLVSPPFDVSGLSQINLSFAYDYYNLSSSEVAAVDVSADGGSTWVNVVTWNSSNRGPATFSQDVTALLAGSTQARVRFHYYAPGWDWWWEVDDVVLGNPVCQAPSDGGLVVGNVYDGNYPTVALNGATVVNADGDETTAVATPLDAAVDDAFYTLFAPSGVQVFTATMTGGYGPDMATVTVVDGDTVEQDFNLPAGMLDATPDGIAVTVELGYADSATLNLENVGSIAAEFELKEHEGQYVPIHIPAYTGNLPADDAPVSTGLAPQGTVPVASEPSPMASVLSGVPAFAINLFTDELTTFMSDTPGTWTVIGASGIGSAYSGDFLNGDFSQMYVIDNDDGGFYVVDTATGAATLLGSSTPQSGHTWTGMTGSVDGTLYAASTNGSASYLYTIDPATGATTVVGEITNAPAIIDIAINADGEMYGVEIIGDVLVAIDPATGAGTEVGSLGVSANYAQGMDFEEESGVLYWAAYTSSGELRIIDTATGASTGVGAFPGGAEVDCLAFATGGASDVPWLMETPTMGSVPAAGSTPIALDFDAAYVDQPGEYHAELIVKNDTPYGKFSVPVTMTVIAPASWAELTGTVTGLGVCDGDPAPLEEAEVLVESATTGMTWMVTTDASGMYQLWLDQAHSPVTITVTAPDYFGEAGGVVVQQGATTVVDFDLRLILPCLSYDPADFDVTLPMGDNTVELLTMSNTGAAEAAFELVEMPGGFMPQAVMSLSPNAIPTREPLPGYNPDATTTNNILSPGSTPPLGILAAGDVLAQWGTGMVLPWGAGFNLGDQMVWLNDNVAGGGSGLNEEFDVAGNRTGASFTPNFGGSWPGDMAYNPNTGMFWQVNVGGDNCIYEWDPSIPAATGNSICGAAWTGTSQRGLAYDPTTDTFFIGGWNEYIVYHIDNTGSVIEQWNLGISISGLAYNFDAGYLFIIENTPTDTITVFDVASGSIVDTFTVAGFGSYSAAGLAIDCDGNLWAPNMNTFNAYLIDSGVPADLCAGGGPGGGIPWLTEDPISGTIAMDTDAIVDLGFDAGVPETMQPGTYYGELKVNSNAANEVPNVPVTLTVTAPDTWGKVAGVVTGLGYCDVATPTLLEEAEVIVESGTGLVAWPLLTNENGEYQLWLDVAHSPVTITVAFPDHITQIFTDVVVMAGGTTVVDAALRWAMPCLMVDPDMFDVTVTLGMSTTVPFTLTNAGVVGTNFDLAEENGGMHMLLPQLMAPSAPAATGGTSVSLLQFGASNVTLGEGVVSPNFPPEDILLDQAPNQSNGIFSDASCDLCTYGVQVLAENFSLSSQETIGHIVLWSGYYSTDTPIDPDHITVIFHADASGSPGTTLSTETDVPYERVQTGVVLFGVHEWMHTLNLAHPVTLAPGTYWVEIYNDTGYGTDDFFWEVGDADTVGNGLTGSAFAFSAPGSGWNIDSATEMSIQLVRSSGGVSGGGIPWLFEDPESGTVDADDTFVVDLTFDASDAVTQVTQPGEYFGTLFVNSDDPVNDEIPVPVTMTVLPPATWGKLMGTVTGLGYCDADPAPLAGADVLVESWMTETVMLPSTVNLLDEDFEGTFPPAGWAVADNAGTGHYWFQSATNYTNGSGYSAAADSDGVCDGSGWDTELWSPPLDLTGISAPMLSYESNFQDYAGAGDAWLDVSTNGGTSWTNLTYWTDDYGPTFETVDLSAYVGQTIILRWRYSDNNDGCAWYWHIDDVLVTGETAGLVDRPISWALTTDVSGTYQVWLDEMYSPLTITVSAADHSKGEAMPVYVTGGSVTEENFDLRWLEPCVTVAPDAIIETVALGVSTTVPMTITNDGAVNSAWSLYTASMPTWLMADPTSGNVAANGGEAPITVTLDSSGLAQPGEYTYMITSFSDDPMYPVVDTPVTFTVMPPTSWGQLTGEVSSTGHCDINLAPLPGADVLIESWLTDVNTVTVPLLEEGFEGTFPPTGWSLFQSEVDDPGWQRSTTAYSGSGSAWHNDDNLAIASDAWLISPQVSVPAGGAMLSFWERDVYSLGSYYDYHGVLVTTDADPNPVTATYTELYSGDVGTTWAENTLDLSAYAGQDIYLAFLYSGDYADEWYVDDVSVSYEMQAVVPVYTFNTTTDQDGMYSYWMPAGSYTVTVTEADHVGDFAIVTVPTPGAVAQDFSLQWIGPCVTSIAPSAMEVTVAMGMSTTLPLTMTNAGAGALNFRFSEEDESFEPSVFAYNLGSLSTVGSDISASPEADNGTEILSGLPAGTSGQVLALPNPWVVIPSVPVAVSRPAGAVVDGKFYVVGGEASGGARNGDVQIYDPATGTWDNSAPMMPTGLSNICAAAIGDAIYVPGGWTGSVGVADLQVFHTDSNTWETVTSDPLPSANYASACAAYNGKLYVFGGGNVNVNWVYDPAASAGSRWATLTSPPLSSGYGAALAVGDQIFYSGLGASANSVAVYAYVPASDTWVTYPSLNTARGGAGMWAIGNMLYVGGGGWSSYLTSVEEYDTSLGTGGSWSVTNPLIQGRRTFAWASSPETGRLYVGAGWAGAYLSEAEETAFPPIGGIPWLFEDPEYGAVPALTAGTADIIFDAGVPEVTQPGTYAGILTVNNDDPVWDGYSLPVTMHVTLPATYGQITGIVMGLGPCDDPLTAAPLAGAEVTVESAMQTWTLFTSADGGYALWLDEAHSPVTITVMADDYVTGVATAVMVVSGTTTVQDFDLSPEAPCLAVTPADAHVTLAMGASTTLPITVGNTGAAALDWSVKEADAGFQIMAPSAGEDVLVVAYDTTAATAMETALTNLGYTYLRVSSTTFQTMALADLLEYKAVFYAGSYASDGWVQAMAYLDAGGSLYISDNDLGWSQGSTIFYQTYLQAVYVGDDPGIDTLIGEDIMAGLTVDITADYYPDHFTVGAEGTRIFQFLGGNAAGVKVARNDYKAIYTSFDFNFVSVTDGEAIVERIMGFLATAGVPWLDEDPTTGTVAPMATEPVTLTFDASVPEVTQPGDYYATLTFKAGDTELGMPVTMTVEVPATWGKLEGLVQGLGYCDVMTEPLEGAVVFIESTVTTDTWALETDAAGMYGLWLDEMYSPLTVTIAYEAGYGEQVFTGVDIVSGTVTILDADLLWLQPCITVAPDALDFSVPMGTSITVGLNLANMGAFTGSFELDELSLGIEILGPLAAGGPDSFGYQFADSASGVGPVYDFVDISGMGAPVALGDNDSAEVDIGFDFKFYGNSDVDPTLYNTVFVNSNGFLSFGAGSTDISPDPLPDPTLPNNLIAAAWDDLKPGVGGMVYVESFGHCPYAQDPTTVDACFIAQYENFVHADDSPAGTFEVILFRSGSILMQYADIAAPDATTGIEGPLGLVGLNYGPALADELAICFAYPGEALDCQSDQVPWLATDVDEGDIAAYDDVTIDVTLDASVPEVTEPGDYLAELWVTSNDPVNPLWIIPVTMTVDMPTTLGKMWGTVYAWGYCDAVSTTMAGAQVMIEDGVGGAWMTYADADGNYGMWLPVSDAVTMTVMADGYVAETMVDAVVSGVMPAHDAELHADMPCVQCATAEYNVIVVQGESTTRMLTLANAGAGELSYDNYYATSMWLSVAPGSGVIAPYSSEEVALVFDSTGLAVGVYNSNMEIIHNDPEAGRVFVRPIQMTVVAEGTILLPMMDAKEGNPGEMVTYAMTVTNFADTAVTFDLLATGNVWTTTAPATVTVAAGGTATFDVDVEIPVDAHTGYSDTVTITAESQGADGQIGVAMLQTTVAEQPVVLALTKTADPADYVLPGDTITYTITFANNGNDPITIALTDPIPAGTMYVLESVTGGAEFNDPPGNNVVWDGVLDNGAQHTITFQVTVNAGLELGTLITNTATATVDMMPYTAWATVRVGKPMQYIYLPLVMRNAQ